MGQRVDIYSFTPSERQALVNLILQYLTDAVVAAHVTIIHNDVHIFTGHRTYIEELEAFLASQGAQRFVPLPKWDPATPIPSEFNVVKPQDDGTPRPPLRNLNPNLPMPPQFAAPAVCAIADGNALGNAVNRPWHGDVHIAVGGTMSLFSIASAAPIFWCWHAFVDEIYYDWQRCGERGNLLHLSGVTSDPRGVHLWHTIRREDGTWFPFGDVEVEAGARGTMVDVDLQNIGAEIHLCAVNSLGNLWHTIRRQDGTWFPFGDVESQAGDRGTLVRVSVAGVNDELHVCGVTSDGNLWHTIRRQDGTWFPFGDVKQQAGDRGSFVEVDCAGIGGELHVTGTTEDGNLWHTIRREDGTWFEFGDVKQQAGDRGVIKDVACAGIANELHVCSTSEDGNLWHTIRREDGTWFEFGDVKQQAGDRGPSGHVSIGECGGEFHVSGTTVENPECGQIRVDISQRYARIEDLNLSKDILDPRNEIDRGLIDKINQQISDLSGEIAALEQRLQQLACSPLSNLWHTIRREDGTWFQFGDVEGQAGERGYFEAVSVDGIFIQA
jgi:hypothetical protein